MLKINIIIASLLAFLTASGQIKYVSGFVITNQQDTIYGDFNLITDMDKKLINAKYQERIAFTNNLGEKTFYEPGDIRSFQFFYDFETFRFASVPYFKNGWRFMKVISEKGYLKLYRLYVDNDKRLMASLYDLADFVYSPFGDFDQSFFYLLKPDKSVLILGKHTPQQKILSFFGDCTEVAEKIASRRYCYTDVYRMVREYNHWKQKRAQALNKDGRIDDGKGA